MQCSVALYHLNQLQLQGQAAVIFRHGKRFHMTVLGKFVWNSVDSCVESHAASHAERLLVTLRKTEIDQRPVATSLSQICCQHESNFALKLIT